MIRKITKVFVTLLFVLSISSTAFAETTIRIASVSGPSHHHNTALNWFADKINKQKIGVNIKVLSGGQLGKSEREYIEGMQQGSIQMAQVIIFDLSLDETSNNFVPNKQMLQPNEF